MDRLDLQDADAWIEEAGRLGGGLVAEFEAVQGVITAQTLRYQWLGEGDISELYPWYIKHLVRLHTVAQELAPRGDWASVPFHLKPRDAHSYEALIMKIRSILVTLPEVHSGEEDVSVMVATPKKEGDKG